MDPDQIRRFRLLLGAALTLIVVGGTIDLILDDPDRWLKGMRRLRARSLS